MHCSSARARSHQGPEVMANCSSAAYFMTGCRVYRLPWRLRIFATVDLDH